MPPPRASRLASRKSVIPDPSLYATFDSDSSTSSPPKRTSPRRPQQPHSQSQQPLASASGAGSKKRGGRASLEGEEDGDEVVALKSSTRGTHASNGANGRKMGGAGNGSEKARGKAALVVEDEEEESADERSHHRTGAKGGAGSAAGAAAVKGAKRQKTAGGSSQEMVEESARKGFVPRAAAGASAKASSSSFTNKLRAGGAQDDSDTIAFSTLPPTPNDAARKRSAVVVKENPRSKTQRRLDRADPPRSPSPSTGDGLTTVYASAIDTPKNKQNRAYREGIPATPGTTTAASRSARRASSENRGKRASGIGTGFEALPHRGVPNERLYRHAGAQDVPVALRMRSVLSWAAQRRREEVAPSGGGPIRVSQASRESIQAFVKRVCDSSLDTSARGREEDGARRSDRLPHPQNQANSKKMKELEDAYAAIQLEQDDRDKVGARYDGLWQRRELQRQTVAQRAAVGTEGEIVIPQGMTGGPSTLDEAIRLGKQLLQSSSAKGSKEAAAPQEEVDRETLALRLRIAAFKQATHRSTSFVYTADQYITSRATQAAQALKVESERGLAAHASTAGATGGEAEGGERRDLASAARPKTGPGAGGGGGRGVLDVRDLLRAISSTDGKSRGG